MSDQVHLLNIKAVCARTGLCRTAVYDRLTQNAFPAPVKLGPQTVRWRSDEVSAWIDKVSAARAA